MSHFPEDRALPEPEPKSRLIVCTRGNKPLHPDDKKALEEWIAMVKARHAKQATRQKGSSEHGIRKPTQDS